MGDDSQGSLTKWGKLRNSPDPDVRKEAARKIVNAFDQQLLELIESHLGSELHGRGDAEEVLQSVFESLFLRTSGREASFPNRNAMFGYLRAVAIHKAENLRKYHHRQIRDVNREVHVEDHTADSPDARVDPLEHGRKVVPPERIKREYHREPDPNAAQLGSAESYYEDAPVDLMCHGASPEHAAIVVDLVDSLRDHDEREGDCLCEIVQMSIEGRRAAEIAEKLKKSRRTVERKRELIKKLWQESKIVKVKVEGQADAAEGRLLAVGPTATVADILRRLRVEGYRLYREVAGEPINVSSATELVYPYIAEGDVLRALRV